jgi:hypothetical protein
MLGKSTHGKIPIVMKVAMKLSASHALKYAGVLIVKRPATIVENVGKWKKINSYSKNN